MWSKKLSTVFTCDLGVTGYSVGQFLYLGLTLETKKSLKGLYIQYSFNVYDTNDNQLQLLNKANQIKALLEVWLL